MVLIYGLLLDIWVKYEVCIPLESESSILSTCNAFVFLFHPSKLKFAMLFCSIYKGLISFGAILFLVTFVQWKIAINGMSVICVTPKPNPKWI